MIEYADVVGRILAKAHARSGDAAAISGYLGKNDTFDEAIGSFSLAYADQSERDYEKLMKAIDKGRVAVASEEGRSGIKAPAGARGKGVPGVLSGVASV